MTTETEYRALLEQAINALEAAKNGLLWYQDTYPDVADGSDDEAMGYIDSALETINAELAKPAKVVPEPVDCQHRRIKWTAFFDSGTCLDCGQKLTWPKGAPSPRPAL